MTKRTEERTRAVIDVISLLGFVGASHYCPDCGNTFHDDRGQHAPDCPFHKQSQDDQEWEWWYESWKEKFPPREPT